MFYTNIYLQEKKWFKSMFNFDDEPPAKISKSANIQEKIKNIEASTIYSNLNIIV